MHRSMWALLLAPLAMAADPAPPRYAVGRPATAPMIELADISVLPTGAGLPKGRGTVREGASIYATHCAACHGDRGEGRDNFAALVGGRGTLADSTPVLTVGSYWPYATTVFDYIRRAMPYAAPGSLSTDEVYAVTAWLLYANDIIRNDFVIDQQTLPRVIMPNRNGFEPDPRPDVPAATH